MIDFQGAILDQPANLREGGDAVREALAAAELAPLRSGTLVFGAIGASHHAAIPVVRALRNAGRRVQLLSAQELASPVARSLGDAFVLVSQSGRSRETVAALQALEGAPVAAVSAQADSPVARGATIWLPLGPRPDTPVATLSYTATLQTLGMLGDALLGTVDGAWERLPELAAEVLSGCRGTVEALAPAFAQASVIDAIGAGSAAASAGEAALLAREGLRTPATGMETREYLHGPLESVAPGLGAIVFGGSREADLAAELRSYGAETILVGEAAAVGRGAGTLGLPAASELAAPVLQILPVQLLAERVARLRGLPIGELRRSQQDTKVAP